MRVLVVEDDLDLRHAVADAIRREHHAVDVAASLTEASRLMAVTVYDVAVVDRGLPDGDGVALCDPAAIDASAQRPGRVLLLTARDAVVDRVVGLDAGADDYLVKPFALDELLARLRAIARRRQHGSARAIVVGDLELDVVGHRVRRGGVGLRVTSREFGVLRHLAERAGDVVSAEELLERCWDAHANPFTDSVRVIISRLRRKLGDPPLLHTVIGAGYRIEPAALRPRAERGPEPPPAGTHR